MPHIVTFDSACHHYLDFLIVYKGKSHGVIDLATLSWVLPTEYKFISNDAFITTQNANCELNNPEPKLESLYFLCTKKDGTELYIDRNKNEFLEKK
jgi:hypothetical protein